MTQKEVCVVVKKQMLITKESAPVWFHCGKYMCIKRLKEYFLAVTI